MKRGVLCGAFLVLVLGCSSRLEGDVPLTVTNPPRCAAGHEPTRQIVVRIERGSDFVQQALAEKMVAANTWAGRNATVKVALCPKGDPCATPNWIRTAETVIQGGDAGLRVQIPRIEVPCDDRSVASN